MSYSERVGQTLGMGIKGLVHGIIQRLAEEVLPRLRLDAYVGTPMALFEYRPVLRLV